MRKPSPEQGSKDQLGIVTKVLSGESNQMKDLMTKVPMKKGGTDRKKILLEKIQPYAERVSFLGAIVTIPELMTELKSQELITPNEVDWIKRNFPSTEDGVQMGLDAAYSVYDRIAGLDDETVELFFDLNAILLGH